VSRHDDEWLADILDAIESIGSYLKRGSLDDGLVFDAVRLRLVEIGEAVKRIGPDVLAAEPDIPWEDVAGMRDRLAHRYFDTSHAIVQATVDGDLPSWRPESGASGTGHAHAEHAFRRMPHFRYLRCQDRAPPV
jgi:uncharacterized protein with HEPN domain